MNQRHVRDAAGAWARALDGTGFVTMEPNGFEDFLAGLVDGLAGALPAPRFSADVGRQVGQALVSAHLIGPEVLGRTVTVLAEHLPREAGALSDEELRTRLAALLGALTSGYETAARDRILRDQESVYQAVLAARDAAQHALHTSQARFRAVFEDAAIGIGIADLDGRIIDVNKALARMFGLSREQMRQASVTEFVHADDATSVWETYCELVRGERDSYRMEKKYHRPDGGEVWTELTVSLIRDEAGQPLYQVALMEDITERHALQSQLRHQVLHDPLTGLPNRTLLQERLHQVFDSAAPGARIGLCYLDLDDFKVVNDSLGHDVGDEFLVAVAQRLRDWASPHGHLVARMGGDEFAILASGSHTAGAVSRIAEQMLATVEEPVRIRGQELSLSATAGVVERQVAGTTAADLVKAADITLHTAKAERRGGWAAYDPQRNAQEIARYTLSANMPAAIERGEFFLHYQPLVRLADSRTFGFEVLSRWRHPGFGVLSPDRFIDLAEKTGLIVPLGRRILQEACQQARQWRDLVCDGDPLISVNLAVRQCRDPGLVADVEQILDATGLDPERLQLEITESAIVGSADGPLDSLRTLATLGVRIAIDDFGTGYSNLAYLRHMPVHSLKIAGPFLEGLRYVDSPDPVDEQLVGTLIRLAHVLGLDVTAEGIETPAQAERLRELKCDSGQGWYFGRPAFPQDVVSVPTVAALPHAS